MVSRSGAPWHGNASPRKAPVERSRFHRALLATFVTGLSLLLIVGLVFGAAYGSRQITSSATALHKADEVLRAATVIRAQLALAVYMAAVDREIGTVSSEPIGHSLAEVEQALADARAGLDGLGADLPELPAPVQATVEDYLTVAVDTIDLLTSNQVEQARAMAESQLDAHFARLSLEIVDLRDGLAATVASSDHLLGRIGDLARFLVAFLVPAAVIIIYRELVHRYQRQVDLEARLAAERDLGRARDEFIANASHELRTPLTGIHGLAMILEEDPAIRESVSARELLNLIISESTDLARMIEDLLTTARLDADALHYTIEELSVMEEVLESVGAMLRIGIQIHIDCVPATIRGDRMRIRQVLRNLMSNAYKYGGPDIRVVGQPDGDVYRLAVVDNGAGVPEELEEKLFQRFLHQGNRTAVLGSVGLGLSIVAALVEGMGGTVSYDREYGETAFVVSLPMVASPELASTGPGTPARPGTPFWMRA